MPDGTYISITQGEGMMGDRSDGTVEIGLLNNKGILVGDPLEYVDGSQLHQILEGML